MSPEEPSPRGRRPRNSLSRPTILDAAKKIANIETVAEVTIRKLAKELDVTPMAIYRHFDNKAEILSELLDEFIREAEVLNHSENSWEEWIHSTYEKMLVALAAHPYFLPLLGKSLILGPSAVEVTEKVLNVLIAAGIKREHASRAFITLMNYTIGAATTQSSMGNVTRTKDSTLKEKSIKKSAGNMKYFSAANHPTLMDLATDMAQSVAGEHFHHGIEYILAGFKTEIAEKI